MTLTSPHLSGVYVALPTPFKPGGSADLKRLDSILEFLLGKGLTGFCIGGATGEYAACGVDERIALFKRVARRVGSRAALIFGVGGEHSGHVRRLARAAADCGGVAVLLPPPCFFQFDPPDLADFLRQVAAELPLPVLLYNIPQFTAGVGLENVLRLIRSVPNIIGVKDSSGLPENLPVIREAKASTPLTFMIGSDDLLLTALESGADGAVSGTAAACPELVLAVYQASISGKREEARMLQALLGQFLSRIAEFPPPWAMKLALRARGIDPGDLNWPLGERLQSEVKTLQDWLPGWIDQCEAACSKVGLEARGGKRGEKALK